MADDRNDDLAPGEYVSLGPDSSCLDGNFTVEQLLAIALAMLALRREREQSGAG